MWVTSSTFRAMIQDQTKSEDNIARLENTVASQNTLIEKLESEIQGLKNEFSFIQNGSVKKLDKSAEQAFNKADLELKRRNQTRIKSLGAITK